MVTWVELVTVPALLPYSSGLAASSLRLSLMSQSTGLAPFVESIPIFNPIGFDEASGGPFCYCDWILCASFRLAFLLSDLEISL